MLRLDAILKASGDSSILPPVAKRWRPKNRVSPPELRVQDLGVLRLRHMHVACCCDLLPREGLWSRLEVLQSRVGDFKSPRKTHPPTPYTC